MGHTDLYVLSSKPFHVLGCLLLVIAAYRDIVIPLNLYLNILGKSTVSRLPYTFSKEVCSVIVL